MRRMLIVNKNSFSTDMAILIARIGIAALMLTHGIPKMMMIFEEEVQFPSVMGMSAELSLAIAVFAEVFCSVLLLAGYATRFASIPLIIIMLVAALSIHSGDPFAKQELAFLYLLIYIVLLLLGSGKYSMDYLLHRKGSATNYNVEAIQA